jgi:hypothetical protein
LSQITLAMFVKYQTRKPAGPIGAGCDSLPCDNVARPELP